MKKQAIIAIMTVIMALMMPFTAFAETVETETETSTNAEATEVIEAEDEAELLADAEVRAETDTDSIEVAGVENGEHPLVICTTLGYTTSEFGVLSPVEMKTRNGSIVVDIPTAAPTISVGDGTPDENEIVTIPVTLEGGFVDELKFELAYDADSFVFVEATNGEVYADGKFTSGIANSGVVVAEFSGGKEVGNGLLANIILRAKVGIIGGEYPVTATTCTATLDGNEIEVSVKDGIITVPESERATVALSVTSATITSAEDEAVVTVSLDAGDEVVAKLNHIEFEVQYPGLEPSFKGFSKVESVIPDMDSFRVMGTATSTVRWTYNGSITATSGKVIDYCFNTGGSVADGTYPLTITNAVVTTTDGTPIQVVCKDGSVIVAVDSATPGIARARASSGHKIKTTVALRTTDTLAVAFYKANGQMINIQLLAYRDGDAGNHRAATASDAGYVDYSIDIPADAASAQVMLLDSNACPLCPSKTVTIQ